ncbi:hypothetical protein [Streptomyces fungicidicus]|uniref:hypothetical protein n=1 Tax=Streptomyces fungicidicus TaxID=68203 RepID=UPI0036AE79A8
MSNYEIRVQEPSDVAKSYGMDYPLFVVWDTVADKRVPFGNYRERAGAVARLVRLESGR